MVANIKKVYKVLSGKIENDDRTGLAVHIIIMLVIVGVVFGAYLTGHKSFVFRDIALDSINQTYPGLVNLARDISNGEFLPRWNFVNSLGTSTDITLPTLANLPAFFGSQNVRYLMGFFEAAKVFFAGVFFWLYLKKLDISNITASIFAVFYAFCAHMIIRASWESYPNEVLMVAVWLYAFEIWNKNKKQWILFWATVFFYLNSSAYGVVLYTGVFAVYALFRTLGFSDEVAIDRSEILHKSAGFIVLIACALLASAIKWGNGLLTSISSNRFENGAESFSSYGINNIFTNLSYIKTSFFRTIGMDILGVTTDYAGTRNFLEDPAYYCGIFTILIVPTAILNSKGKKKIAYCIGIAGICLYIFITPFHLVLSAFTGAYKLSSFWVMALLLFIAASELDDLADNPKKIAIGVSIWLVILSIVWHIEGMDTLKLLKSWIFIFCYVLLIYLLKAGILEAKGFKNLLLCLALVEVIVMSYGVINNRVTMDEKDYYQDGTIEALDYIEDTATDAVFYRVDKLYNSVYLCDSRYQDYMGTVGYNGGTGDRESTGEFCRLLSMPIRDNNHYFYGFGSSTIVNTLVNIRYILSKSEEPSNFGYSKAGEESGISIYENEYYLPLGYVYDEYITLEEFEELSAEDKRRTLLNACIIEEDSDIRIGKIADIPQMIDLTGYEAESDIERSDTSVVVNLPLKENGYVNIVEIEADSTSYACLQYNICNQEGQNVTEYFAVSKGNDTYYLEFNDSGTQKIQIKAVVNSYDFGNFKNIKVYQIPQNIYYEYYIERCTALRSNGIDVVSMDSNLIQGTLESDIDGVMALSIPYDENWHLYIDGEETELFTVNVGMMGAQISAGSHDVKLVYRGNGILLLCLLGGIFLMCTFVLISNRQINSVKKRRK